MSEDIDANGPVRVLIVDDHRMFVDALCILLDRSDRIEVVAVATDGVEAIDLAMELDPEVVLMDIKLPRVDGLEVTRLLCERKPDARVIVLSSQTEDEGGREALAAGATAFMTKTVVYDEVEQAIFAAAAR
jgi:DNA-binding NarL/FixJ family response regulator